MSEKKAAEPSADEYFNEQEKFNKWLRELTDSEREHVVLMLNEFAESYSLHKRKEAFEAGREAEREKIHAEFNEPYFGWCDVEGCESEACSGGSAWRETGYWRICHKHSDEWRKGNPSPQMKQTAEDRENSRDKVTGYLPAPCAHKNKTWNKDAGVDVCDGCNNKC